MKYLMAALVIAALCLTLAAPVWAAAEEAPAVSAHAAVVMEAQSGQVLWQQRSEERMPIASVTKIMTALVVLERCPLDTVVTVDAAWTGIEGSSMYLEPGQKLTVEELLYGLMLASGNDAAVALACVTAGSVEDFAALMNAKAAALGCENTHFTNPNGLDEEGHYASAMDLALITREALKQEPFRRIVSTAEKTVGTQTFTNHNRLLRECEGVFGVKTGYTMAAGRTLVTACERNGLTLICVTLSDPDDWQDHEALYAWAYGQYARDDVLAGVSWTVPVIGGVQETVTVSAPAGLSIFHRGSDEIEIQYHLPAFVYADVQAGGEAGQAVAYIRGHEAGRAALVYAQDVPRAVSDEPTFWSRLRTLFEGGEGSVYTFR